MRREELKHSRIGSARINALLLGARSGPMRRRGFTLIELLVVMAILGILGSLVVPSLSRAKATAESTCCRNNLRQHALALNMYLHDSGGKYPLGYQAFGYSSPYITSRQGVQFCSAAKRFNESMLTAGDRRSAPTCGYEFNSEGTGWARLDGVRECYLGLGGSFKDVPGRVPVWMALPESAVRMPSDMIALIHVVNTGSGCASYSARMGFGWPGVPENPRTGAPLHRGGENAAFCDGHVESENSDRIQRWSSSVFKADVAHARRWNHDNQPHQETWLEY